MLYAYNADAPQHRIAAQWLKKLFDSDEIVALPWITLWAFIRISTNSRIWNNPFSSRQAFAVVKGWLELSNVVVLEPGPRHMQLLLQFVSENSATGPLMTDAVLAALAMENGASLASADQDFGRFTGLRWINPLRK